MMMSCGSPKFKIPSWLNSLLDTKFFEVCEAHKDLRKSETNTYCINCNATMCQHCQCDDAHKDHKLLQIRRYVYQSVVRVQDIQKLIDCSKIQPFTVNSAKVVLLNPKNNGKASGSKDGPACGICQRTITEPNLYCSIACKVSECGTIDSDATGPIQQCMSSEIKQVAEVLESAQEKAVEDVQFGTSLRKRGRKGIPRRAHFY